MHILVQGSKEHETTQAFLRQSIYDSVRSRSGCLSGVDKRQLHSIHPSGVAEARTYLKKVGKDEAYYQPDPSMVDVYATYMCETKNFGSSQALPQLPQEYVVCLLLLLFQNFHLFD